MKAWRVVRLGEPGHALEMCEVDVPRPGEGELLVRVSAAALGLPDVLRCRGRDQVRPRVPFTAGGELCGEVVGTGERVIGTPKSPHGALAEYTLMNHDEVLPAPSSLDDCQAAGLLIGYQSAWFGLHRRARLQPGETLLVHAAAGGVGSAAVQLGKAAGAKVIAVVGGARKAEVAADLGADVVVDRRRQDFVAEVKEATGWRGADVVFDPVGGDAYASSTRCVAFEGRIVVVGFAGGTIPAPQLSHAMVKNYSIMGLHWELYRQHDPKSVATVHQALTKLAEDGAIEPLISERLAFDQVVDGLTRLGDGETTGRIVVRSHGS